MGFVSDGSWLGFVVGNEGDHVEVTDRSEVTGGGRTEALKLGRRGGFGLFSAPVRLSAARFRQRRVLTVMGHGLELERDVQASSGWSRPGLAGNVAGNWLQNLQNSETLEILVSSSASAASQVVGAVFGWCVASPG